MNSRYNFANGTAKRSAPKSKAPDNPDPALSCKMDVEYDGVRDQWNLRMSVTDHFENKTYNANESGVKLPPVNSMFASDPFAMLIDSVAENMKIFLRSRYQGRSIIPEEAPKHIASGRPR